MKIRPKENDDISDLLLLFDATGQNISALNRTHHYVFAHSVIPSLFYSDPDDFINRLVKDGRTFLQGLWQKVKEQMHNDPNTDKECMDDLTFDLYSTECGTTIATVILPTPETIAEAYFVSTVYRPETEKESIKQVITLEYGLDRDGHSRTVIGAWTPEGNHLNYGDGTPPELDAFLASISVMIAHNFS